MHGNIKQGDIMTGRETVNKTKKLALGAVLTALVVIVLYFIPVIPTNTLSLYALSSFFVAVAVIEAGIVYGWIFYGASSLLGLIIAPDKLALIPYITFFGLYGLLKYYIEKLKYRPLQFLIKLIVFNTFLTAAYFLVNEFIFDRIKLNIPFAVIIVLLEIAFVLYDYVYSLFIEYYRHKLKRLLRI